MVKVSHARCRQCGQTRHRNAKFNLCGRCWARKKPEYRAEWARVKARRAIKREEAQLPVAAAIELLEEESAPMPRGRATSLTAEQEQEIVTLYTTTDTSVIEIARTYGIGDTVPYNVLSKHGVSWRRGDGRQLPPHIEAMKQVHVAAPTPAALEESVPTLPEEEMRAALERVLPSTNDHVALPQWRVEFHSSMTLRAANVAEVLREVEFAGYRMEDVDGIVKVAE